MQIAPCCYWAQALAYGPNINDFGYTASPEALLASGKAIEFSGRCTEKEDGIDRSATYSLFIRFI